ncbi:hypothetical protein [Mycobacterium sp. ENV421]|uniref:hypothetical protein n=1 Tax=Mycobacterium sp. ENV421 TaxID=1213407 RepID=UPI00336AEC7E
MNNRVPAIEQDLESDAPAESDVGDVGGRPALGGGNGSDDDGSIATVEYPPDDPAREAGGITELASQTGKRAVDERHTSH